MTEFKPVQPHIPRDSAPQIRLLIVGGSTRAAAWSARRAGFQPICADLFADLDTRQIADVIPVLKYPDSLIDDVATVAADGWFYTGALENRPDLIEQMQNANGRYGPLWGTSPASLRLIRDPFWVAEILKRAGRPSLEVLPQAAQPPRNGEWMRKPVASSGGHGVSVWDDQGLSRSVSEPFYFQRRQHGTTLSALYMGRGDSIELLGMTQPLISYERSHAAEPFLYCGSIGPLQRTWPFGDLNETGPLSYDCLCRLLTSQIEVLATQTKLRGIFGVDFIRDEQGFPWIIEVNPRYTASVEILELAQRRSLLSEVRTPHVQIEKSSGMPVVVAKVILYARHSFLAPDFGEFRSFQSDWDVPELADVPVSGTRIEPTWPICTVLSSGLTSSDCLKRLGDRVDTVWKMVNDRACRTVSIP